jgi:hypothetical protein
MTYWKVKQYFLQTTRQGSPEVEEASENRGS